MCNVIEKSSLTCQPVLNLEFFIIATINELSPSQKPVTKLGSNFEPVE